MAETPPPADAPRTRTVIIAHLVKDDTKGITPPDIFNERDPDAIKWRERINGMLDDLHAGNKVTAPEWLEFEVVYDVEVKEESNDDSNGSD